MKSTAVDPGCAKTRAFNLLVESSLNLVNLKTKNARDGYPRKAIEKPVLRFLGAHTFSRGLDPKRKLAPPSLGATTRLMHRSKKALFDHLVGLRDQQGRQLQAELPCSFLVHDQLKFGWGLNRQSGRIGTT